MDKQAMLNWLEGQEGMLSKMARAIWEKPELAMEEVFASGLQRDALAAAGFQVREVPGVSTAFAAEYGHGKPVLGILGEYDALPDLSQQQGPERRALRRFARARQAMAAGTTCWAPRAWVRPWRWQRQSRAARWRARCGITAARPRRPSAARP